MGSIDKKLQEARKNIAELEGGFNFTIQKNKSPGANHKYLMVSM